jgi:hypothetical protein
MEKAMARPPPNTEVVFPGSETSLPLDALKATIAMELAAGLTDAPGVRERYGISSAQWDILRRTPIFREMLKEAIVRLSGDVGAANRIKLKSDVMLEDNLKVLDEIANDRDAQSMARIKALEFTAQLAGKGGAAPKTEGGGQGMFSLNIIIPGAGEVRVEGDMKPALEHVSE